MQIIISKITDQVLFGLLLASALMPLAVAKQLAHPFTTTKDLFLRVIVALALPIAVIVWFKSPKLPRLGFLGWSVFFVWLAASLATVFSVDRANSFWGFAERLTGWLTISLFILWGILLWRLFAGEKRRRIFLGVWSAVWLIVAALAVLERVIPGFWAQFHGEGRRSVSTFGNPIFLSGGLVLAFGLLGVTIADFRSKKNRWLALAAAAVIFGSALIFTETRGAYLGALAGAFAAIFCLALWSRRRFFWIGALAAAATLIIAVGILWILRGNPAVKNAPIIGRVVSIFNGADPSQIQRLQLWGMAFRAIKSRPLFGWGLENFDTAVDRLYDPNFTRFGITNSFSDRAHNNFLDIAATSGIVGLVAYLVFLAALVYQLLRARKLGRLSNFSAAIGLGGIAAYAVASLTSFDTHATYMNLAPLVALIAALAAAPRAAAAPEMTPQHGYGSSFSPVIFAGAVAISAGLIIFGTIPLIRGSRIVRQAIGAASGEELSRAAAAIMTFKNPYRANEEHRIANEIFKDVGNDAERGRPAEELLPLGEKLIRDAVARRPEHFASRFTLANILLVSAMRGLGSFEAAAGMLEEARTLAPNRQMVDYQLGNLYLVQKKPEEAVRVFKRALSLAPDVAVSHWDLGRGLAALGDNPGAAKEFFAAWDRSFGINRPREEINLANNVLLANGDLSMLLYFYRKWSEHEPDNSKIFTSLATVSAMLGDRVQTYKALQRALQLDPSISSEVPDFLKKYGLPSNFLTAPPPHE
ncbi:tetratricopeptide repeat protein [Patescibacteria group bacterium]|nr:MAG: tetratricopeptide repeat protein [Patescibacteria group bacterium]